MKNAALRSIACLLLSSAFSAGSLGQTPNYKGKTVMMTLGSDPGSAGDAYNRVITQFIGRHIPGEPATVVQNMPGADGLTHLNWMYNIAAKDGTVIGLTRQDAAFEPLFSGKSTLAKYDAQKINWLGSPNAFPAVAISWHTSPVKKAEDLLTHELLIGGIGTTSGSTNDAYVLRNVLGFKLRAVLGYPGPTAVDLAMERGETEGRSSAGWTGLRTRHADWLKNGTVNVLYQMGIEKYAEIPPDVPLILEFAKNDADRDLLRLKYASNNIGFPYLLPPGARPEVIEVIQKAFEDTLNDPAFREAAAKQLLDVNPVSADKIKRIIKTVYATSLEILARLNEVSQPPKDLPPLTKK